MRVRSSAICDAYARPIAKGLKGQANRKRLENGANSGDTREGGTEARRTSRAGGKGRKRIRESLMEKVH